MILALMPMMFPVLSRVKPLMQQTRNSAVMFQMRRLKLQFFQLGPLKAPGPDGFSGVFYQQYWKEIKEEVCATIKESFEKDGNIDEYNQNNITLVPKVNHPEYVHLFRPISLCDLSVKNYL